MVQSLTFSRSKASPHRSRTWIWSSGVMRRY